MFRAVLYFSYDTSKRISARGNTLNISTQPLDDLKKVIFVADRLIADCQHFTGYRLEQQISEEIGWVLLEATNTVIC